MKSFKKRNVLGALALAGVLGASGIAATASVEAPSTTSYAGYGTVTVSGGALSSLTYTVDDDTATAAQLTFAAAFTNPDTVVSVKTDGTSWVDCTGNEAQDVYDCTFSAPQSLASLGTLEVRVHDAAAV
jgi:hypothetical protein